jgi:hypothetical protein
VVVPLVAGFVISATAVFGAVWALGDLLRGASIPIWALPLALALCAASDFLFPRIRFPMLRRQTPKHLVGRFHPAVGGLLWGLDTGSVVSTFRASAASWAALILVAAGWGPAWSGFVYAAAFCLPLSTVVLSPDLRPVPLALPDGVKLSAQLTRIAPRIRAASGLVLLVATAVASIHTAHV